MASTSPMILAISCSVSRPLPPRASRASAAEDRASRVEVALAIAACIISIRPSCRRASTWSIIPAEAARLPATSAIWAWISWNAASGRPNCSRRSA